MKRILFFLSVFSMSAFFFSCSNKEEKKSEVSETEFVVEADRFADLQVLRYQVPGFESLSVQQKELAYYLYMAGMSGRDIFYDQKYKHNLRVRKVLECILSSYGGDKKSDDYQSFLVYAKRVFFSNGIHHHYSSIKFEPGFSYEYFTALVNGSDEKLLPLTDNMSKDDLLNMLQGIMFDPTVDASIVDLRSGIDNVKSSANNFYEGVTQKEVEAFYENKKDASLTEQPSWGLNSKLLKENNALVEKVWKVGGMYDKALTQVVFWLEKAVTVAENDNQKKALSLLAEYYKTGDLKTYDDYCVAWVNDTESRIDFANGFIEVYQDAIGKRGAYEAVLSLKDMEASKRIQKISEQAQWFEDNSPLMEAHKKKNVTGISAKVITVINEVGDAAPTTPIGINLPNQEWIRE
ncbi:MAG TPA: dihydrofolate reductase, partial [Bacteroidia bacterium]|nr:dihydrofolate reductase [Bacteroidia bacterium]